MASADEVPSGTEEKKDEESAVPFPEVAEGSSLLLQQDFSELENAFEAGLWEVEGDDVQIYTCSSKLEEGPAGALLDSCRETTRADSWVELVHTLQGGGGAQVCTLCTSFICEMLDNESAASFTVGLSFDEDTVESSLLSITLRRERENPGEDETGVVKPIQLHFNGEMVADKLGPLPLKVELEAELAWDVQAGGRRVRLRHRVTEVSLKEEARIALDASTATQPAGAANPPSSGANSADDASECTAAAAAAAAVGAAETGIPATSSSGAASAAAPAAAAPPIAGDAGFVLTSCSHTIRDFYTKGSRLHSAKALYFRCTGGVKARLLSLKCCS